MHRLMTGALLALSFSLPGQAAIREEAVSYKDGDTVMKGFVVYDDAVKAKRPGIVLVHEWWGITKHVHNEARKFAQQGYTAFIADLYGDAKHASVDPSKIGAVGYCFGGAVVLNMARTGADLAGVAGFHASLGLNTPAPAPGAVKAKVLVLNGADDLFIKPEQIDAFKKDMEAAKVDYKFINYPGAVHAFTNPEATAAGKKFNLPLAYNAEVDKQAKAEAAKFFAGVFGKK